MGWPHPVPRVRHAAVQHGELARLRRGAARLLHPAGAEGGLVKKQWGGVTTDRCTSQCDGWLPVLRAGERDPPGAAVGDVEITEQSNIFLL